MSDQFAYLGIDPQRTLRPGPHDYAGIRDTERRPAVLMTGLKMISFDQSGFVDSAAPSTKVTSNGASGSIRTSAESGRQRRGLVRLSEPIRSFKVLVMDAGGGESGIHLIDRADGVCIPVEAILDSALDLSTIDWNNQGTLTYSTSFNALTILYTSDLPLGSGNIKAAPGVCTPWFDDYQLTLGEAIYGFRFKIDDDDLYTGTERLDAWFRLQGSALVFQP